MDPETLPVKQRRTVTSDLETTPAVTKTDLDGVLPLVARGTPAVTKTDLDGVLSLVARGKVRDIYAVDEETLLFVATDRVSAYDIVMGNVRSGFLCYSLGFSYDSIPLSKEAYNPSLTPH